MSTIAPYQPTFLGALREAGQRFVGNVPTTEAGLETTVATEPIKNWAEQQGPVGQFASNFIPGTRGEGIGAAAQAALLAMTMGASGAAGPGMGGARGMVGATARGGRPQSLPRANPDAMIPDSKRMGAFWRSLQPADRFTPLGEAVTDTFKPWGAYGADFEAPLMEHIKKAGLGLASDAAANINKVGPQNLDDTARRLRVAFGGRDYLSETR